MSEFPAAGENPSSSLSAIGQIDPVFSRQRLSYPDSPSGLGLDNLAATPLAQFRRWYDEALAAGVTEPNAMTLATVDATGGPSARTVLLKHADPTGFVFFTNHSSRKGTELAHHAVAAIVVAWLPQHRQVSARGGVERVSAAATAEYFVSRPWGSRIGAWASHQSQEVASRAGLEARWEELAARWPDRGRADDVPVPPHWGGYVVRPVEVEFWQGRPSRMHDRLVFLPALAGDVPALDAEPSWRVVRREP